MPNDGSILITGAAGQLGSDAALNRETTYLDIAPEKRAEASKMYKLPEHLSGHVQRLTGQQGTGVPNLWHFTRTNSADVANFTPYFILEESSNDAEIFVVFPASSVT